MVQAPLPPSSAVVVDSHRVPSIGDRVHRLARVYVSIIVLVVRLKKKLDVNQFKEICSLLPSGYSSHCSSTLGCSRSSL